MEKSCGANKEVLVLEGDKRNDEHAEYAQR